MILAQTDSLSIYKQGEKYNSTGINFYLENDIDSAIHYINSAASLFKSIKANEEHVCALNNLAFIYNEVRALKKYKEVVFTNLEFSEKHLPLFSVCRATALSNIHSYYFYIGNYKKSIEVLNSALELYLANGSSYERIATSYSNLANSYKFLGEYTNAHNYLNKALLIHKDSFPDHVNVYEIYKDIARLYNAQNQIDSTIYYYEKVENLLSSVKSNDPLIRSKIDNLLLLADLWIEIGDLNKANNYITLVKKIPLTEYYQIQLHETQGRIYSAQKNYEQAIEEFLKGQEIANTTDKRNTPPLKARRLIDLAKAYQGARQLNLALSTYQEGLKALSPTFNNDDYKTNPKVNELLAKLDALTLLNEKATLLFQLYGIHQETKYLKAAYDAYLSATDIIGDVRQGIQTSESKNTLTEKTIKIYEGAIATALELNQKTKQQHYKETALVLAERNKALLLLEHVNEQFAKGFSGIPDSLLEVEKDIQLQLAYLQKVLLEEKSNSKNQAGIQNQIFELKQQLIQLSSDFEKNYPRYFELKYKNDPLSLTDIQTELSAPDALLEYFVGEKVIYLFVVNKKDLEVLTINKSENLSTAIAQLRTNLSTIPDGKNASVSYQTFTTSAHDLFLKILKPAIDQLPQHIQNLTIIPDHELNYIPFSLLLMDPGLPQHPGYSLSDVTYVLQHYNINYHYSATLLHKTRQRQKLGFKNDFLGFAPSFKSINNSMASRSCNNDKLYSLQCSDEEVKSISALIHGKAFVNQDADKSTFMRLAGSGRIIHLATHACIDEHNANYNKIFLSDDFLSNYDLYNLDLQAELAVLSACNTGTGELIKGEGVMSLARGFINAGCSSTLMSMWSVDDCATSAIMIDFYKNLKKGFSKDEALRQAKINYLKDLSNKSKLHPYYWGAFVAFGDMKAMYKDQFSYKLFYAFSVLLLLGGSFFFFRRKK